MPLATQQNALSECCGLLPVINFNCVFFRVANMYNLCLFLVQFVPAGLLSIFISPFADIYGLKVPLMIATAGGCVQVSAHIG